MSDTLPCLSVRQPWASLTAAGIKPIENREWPCRYRGPLLIHAGQTWGKDEERNFRFLMDIAVRIGDKQRQEVLHMSKSLLGGIIGACRMAGCVHRTAWEEMGNPLFDGVNNWFVGAYGWLWQDAYMFPSLIKYKGQQGLFSVPHKIVMHYLREDVA